MPSCLTSTVPKRQRRDASRQAPTDRSLAVRLTLNSDDATLSEEQIEGVVQAVVDQLACNVGARQRV
jgi:phenylalanyl-tRNA synthetase beta chain